ncbi:MAG: hypothetical protein ACI9LM_005468 [Alteromonadaceae bacterium]|jgi:hypothetical protein
MIKLIVGTLLSFIFISFVSLSQAAPITNLFDINLSDRDYANAEDQLSASLLGVNYINYNGYDWAWASPVNVEFFNSNGNILYAPELQKNWQFADEFLLNILRTELTVADFTTTTGDTIQAAQFFNSVYVTVNRNQFSSVSSRFVDPNIPFASLFATYETFYVRPSQVPEPSTLMIFALGLITLVSKKRLFS